ncbi:MAG: hypothetical protein LUG62_08705 [Clostridiales bacterium]|nr:hypothetical protein [Clostridiales bacterium]
MKFLDRMERKYGRFGIPNLTRYIVGAYLIGYLLEMFAPEVLSLLSLDVSKIIHELQIWRVITWVIYPPSSAGSGLDFILFLVAIFFFYYPVGISLERTWGSFRYTLYIFSGILFTVLSAFLLYAITGGYVTIGGFTYSLGGSIFSTYYISLSIFLAYALTYPEQRLLLMFVIPIKMKWMAFVYGILVAWDVVSYIRMGYWFCAVPIVASLLNFLIFFLATRNMSRYNPKEIRRKNQFKKAVSQGRASAGAGGITKHKCAVCGRTEKDDPNLEFRFCSKCNGNYEYCQDHLFTHTHVK